VSFAPIWVIFQNPVTYAILQSSSSVINKMVKLEKWLDLWLLPKTAFDLLVNFCKSDHPKKYWSWYKLYKLMTPWLLDFCFDRRWRSEYRIYWNATPLEVGHTLFNFNDILYKQYFTWPVIVSIQKKMLGWFDNQIAFHVSCEMIYQHNMVEPGIQNNKNWISVMQACNPWAD